MDYSPSGSSVHGDSLGKKTGVGYHVLLWGHLPNSGRGTCESCFQFHKENCEFAKDIVKRKKKKKKAAKLKARAFHIDRWLLLTRLGFP